jgi:hypothetical protein
VTRGNPGLEFDRTIACKRHPIWWGEVRVGRASPQRRGFHRNEACGTDLDGSWSGRSNDSMLDDILRSGAKRAGVATLRACGEASHEAACPCRPETGGLLLLLLWMRGECLLTMLPAVHLYTRASWTCRARRGQHAAAALRLSPGAKMERAGDPAITHAPHVNPFSEHPNPPINLIRAVRRAQ